MELHDIQDIDEAELMKKINQGNNKIAVFIYTPFCGTCALGERMLQIASAAGITVPLYKLNILYAPQLREKWQIASVPCIVILNNGHVVLKEYVMRSVDHLHSLLKH